MKNTSSTAGDIQLIRAQTRQTLGQIPVTPQLIKERPVDIATLTPAQVAAMIDHTLLKPDATAQQIDRLCTEAVENQFASVCVNLTWLAASHQALGDSAVKRCVVIGFPLGATTGATKAFETEQALKDGAQEVDMVLNVGRLKSGDLRTVFDDIHAVVQIAHGGNALVKVILETVLITDEEKIIASVIAMEAGADFVKTSTGFNGGGATTADIALMRSVVGPKLGVKASGGVRTAEDALAMIQAGATRIGASAGVNIVQGFAGDPVESKSKEGY